LMVTVWRFLTSTEHIEAMAALLNADTRRKERLRAKENNTILQLAKGSSNISLINVLYEHTPKAGDDPSRKAPPIGPLSLMFEQGQVMAICGPAQGKKTLLLLLAGVRLPTSGHIAIPGNLRVRYLAGEPVLLTGTVLYNLTFGNKKQHPIEEILACCRAVGVSERLIRYPETEVGRGGGKVAVSDRVCISIARALLSSADVILLANTLDLLKYESAVKIMDLLHVWVKDRGLNILTNDRMDGTDLSLKKKKTVLMTTNALNLDKEADSRIFLSDQY